MKVVLQCEKCGSVEVVEGSVNEAVLPNGDIIESENCRGMKLSAIEQSFGQTDIEHLALAIYGAFHQEDEPGWPEYESHRSDTVVNFYRRMAILVNGMRKEAGIGCVYDD